MKQPWKTKRNVQYQWEETRTVATLPYGGGPSGRAISNMRKRLYDKVMKTEQASWIPVDLVFFWQNNVKACYTEEGLGMAVARLASRLCQSAMKWVLNCIR
jgi:hypothetical protein